MVQHFARNSHKVMILTPLESQNSEVLHSVSYVLRTGGANLLPTDSISWNFDTFEFQDKETTAFHPIFLVSSSSHKQRT